MRYLYHLSQMLDVALLPIFAFEFAYASSVDAPGHLVGVTGVFLHTPSFIRPFALERSATHHLPADTSHGQRALAII